ncbi:hypothetical protein C8F01DRAFT_1157346 [Mycena amicta]|nr:hypothetical protein C8F01DRAFT_1157346 [Mycena amicta]
MNSPLWCRVTVPRTIRLVYKTRGVLTSFHRIHPPTFAAMNVNQPGSFRRHSYPVASSSGSYSDTWSHWQYGNNNKMPLQYRGPHPYHSPMSPYSPLFSPIQAPRSLRPPYPEGNAMAVAERHAQNWGGIEQQPQLYTNDSDWQLPPSISTPPFIDNWSDIFVGLPSLGESSSSASPSSSYLSSPLPESLLRLPSPPLSSSSGTASPAPRRPSASANTSGKPLCNACGLYLQQRNKMRPAALIAADQRPDEEELGEESGPSCSHCGTHKTSVWRRSKTGARVCNACGVYARLRGRDRPLTLRRNKIRPRCKHPK